MVCECFASSSEKKISMRKQDFKIARTRRNQVTADQLFKAISGLQTNSPPSPGKRFRSNPEDIKDDTEINMAAFDTFFENKTTMREGLV